MSLLLQYLLLIAWCQRRIPGSRSGDIGYGFVDLERPGFEQSSNGLGPAPAVPGVRAKHGRSGDPGLWVRNKEQWADRGSEPPAPSCLCERTSCQDPNLRGSKDGSGWNRPVS